MAGGPGQELQLTGASGSPRGLRDALLSSATPPGESPRLPSRESGQEEQQSLGGREESAQACWQGIFSQLTSPSWHMHWVQGSSSKVNTWPFATFLPS